MGNNDWQSQFADGFSSSGGPVDLGGLFWLILVALLLGAAWYAWEWFRRNTASRQSKGHGARYVATPGRLNPLQQVRIQELIDQFRKDEPSAQAVSSAILEKYSEFFYFQTAKLKTSEKEVEEFLGQNFPLKVGDPVELDFHTEGNLHLIKSKVAALGTKGLLVEFQNQVPEFLGSGASIHINYSSGRHFLQGTTQILEVRPDVGLVLKKPTKILLTSERRYSRLPLTKAPGTLQDTKSDYHAPIKVLDISLEGVRVQVGRPLEKTHLYLLTFEAETQGRVYPFGPLECVPSKAFLTGSGTHEAGLVFLTMTMGTRQKLVAFMKLVAQELQAEKKAEEERQREEGRKGDSELV